MKKNLILTILYLSLICIMAEAQMQPLLKVNPTAGGIATTGIINLSYTIGEPVTANLYAGSLRITNGFEQAFLTPSSISGSTSLCVGDSILLTDSTSGGIWSSLNTGIATINSVSGEVIGISSGIDSIKYTYGSTTVYKTITVNPLPNAGNIICQDTICTGNRVSIIETISGGTWSATNACANVSGGLLFANTAGFDTIKYTITNSCGTAIASKIVNIAPTPAPIAVSTTVCLGSTITATDTCTGCVWSLQNGNAIINSLGVITADSLGTDLISYTSSYGCVVNAVITIIGGPDSLLGDSLVCIGNSISLKTNTLSGNWTLSDTTKTHITDSGFISTYKYVTLTGITTGTVTISYSNTCSTIYKNITINPLPSSITVADSLCFGTTALATTTSTGGNWSADSSYVAISSSGNVSTLVGGIGIISYSLPTGCYITHNVYVFNAIPSTFGSDSTVCQNNYLYLPAPEVGGTWSSSSSVIASLYPVSSGLHLYVYAVGTALITYTHACGTVTQQISVNAIPQPINTVSRICTGSSLTLFDSTTGGTWSYITYGHITGDALGHVTGITGGNAEAYYTLPNGCAAEITIPVDTLPNHLTGDSALCPGSSTLIYTPEPGGTWSVSNSSLATVTIVFINDCYLQGLMVGIDTIKYTNTCGTVSKPVTINPNPKPITVASNICLGTTATASDSTILGSWSTSNTYATINSLGVVTSDSVGTDIITYTLPTGCYTTKAIDVINLPTPSAGIISGLSTVCIGSFITLIDTTFTTSGTSILWTSKNAKAGVYAPYSDSTPILGVSAGIDTISFKVTNACGSSLTTHIITINALPASGSILGPLNVCLGTPATLSETTTGGAWSAYNTNATISVSGVINPSALGTDTIYYTKTNICGTAIAIQVITINTLPTIGSIIGLDSVCELSYIVLSSTVSGGSWSAFNMNATVLNDTVNGYLPGVDTIYYYKSNICGTSKTSKTIYINAMPDAGFILGSDTVCQSSSITLSDSVLGGTWSSSDSFASVSPISLGTIINGNIPGLDTIKYTANNSCGTSTALHIVIIMPSPTAGIISGSDTLCLGTTVSLTNTTGSGIWHISNTNVTMSIIGDTSICTGITSGLDTITYVVSNQCGDATAKSVITVNPYPNAGVINGLDSICYHNSTSFSDTITGGIWTLSNTIATLFSSNWITALDTGRDTIIYTIHNDCGEAHAQFGFDIINFNTPNILGINTVCLGCYDTLTGSPSGGSWFITNNSVSLNNGIVKGIMSGTDTIIYVINTFCGIKKDSFIIKCDSEGYVPNIWNSTSAINVFPNPNIGIFTISWFDKATPTLDVYDLLGNKVEYITLSIIADKGEQEIQLPNIAKGTYILKITIGETIYYQKIIIW